MQQKVRKAVIPAAGLGTRVLPATKSMPKEMLPIVDTPSIQLIVEEAVAAGIEDILIITNRGKGLIEDHFDHAVELEFQLERRGREKELEQVRRLANLANISYIRQRETKGLGHAVLCAKNFVGDEPFAVLYGDDVIFSKKPVTKQLMEAYEAYGLPVCGMKEVAPELVLKYCTLKVDAISGDCYRVSDMVEKPATVEECFSNYSILGRVLLTPEVFEILENTPMGHGGELQLTDAMAVLARNKGMIGVDFEGTRYDMGNKLSILKANIERGLLHPETGEGLRAYLKELAKTL